MVVIPPYRDAAVIVEAVVCVLLLIWEPMVRVFIALGNVECGLQELELHMLVLVDAFVLMVTPPSEVIPQRRRELLQIRFVHVLAECL